MATAPPPPFLLPTDDMEFAQKVHAVISVSISLIPRAPPYAAWLVETEMTLLPKKLSAT